MAKAYRGEPPPKGAVPDLAHALAVTIVAVPAFAVDTRPRLNPVLAQRPPPAAR